MNKSSYDPKIHHRHSIRLKGHDYAGGGLYFVTICAHRKFIAATRANPFGPAEVKKMIAKEWEAVGAGLVPAPPQRGTHEGCPYVIMPDHFHALIRIPGSGKSLGDLIGAFKSCVVHEYIARVEAGEWPRFPGKIWHRNYYEMIVRTPEAEKNIARYIQMNPWRCVQQFSNKLRGMGNPALWNRPKLGMLASRGTSVIDPAPSDRADVVMSGFHSPMEKEIFAKLLECKKPLIWCPAWGLERSAFAPGVREALEKNRMLILEMRNRDGNLAAAEQRNRFVMEHADNLWLPHINPGGMIDRLLTELKIESFV